MFTKHSFAPRQVSSTSGAVRLLAEVASHMERHFHGARRENRQSSSDFPAESDALCERGVHPVNISIPEAVATHHYHGIS